MQAIIILTVTALILGVILAIIDRVASKEDESEKEFLKRLPGYNCGACGFGSCSGMAHAMLDDINNYKKCRPLRGEALDKMQEYVAIIIENKENL